MTPHCLRWLEYILYMLVYGLPFRAIFACVGEAGKATRCSGLDLVQKCDEFGFGFGLDWHFSPLTLVWDPREKDYR